MRQTLAAALIAASLGAWVGAPFDAAPASCCCASEGGSSLACAVNEMESCDNGSGPLFSRCPEKETAAAVQAWRMTVPPAFRLTRPLIVSVLAEASMPEHGAVSLERPDPPPRG